MELRKYEEKIRKQIDTTTHSRDRMIDAWLAMIEHTGQINKDIKRITYEIEEIKTKEEKENMIEETKENMKKVLDDIIKIAETMQIKIIDLLD